MNRLIDTDAQTLLCINDYMYNVHVHVPFGIFQMNQKCSVEVVFVQLVGLHQIVMCLEYIDPMCRIIDNNLHIHVIFSFIVLSIFIITIVTIICVNMYVSNYMYLDNMSSHYVSNTSSLTIHCIQCVTLCLQYM